MNSPRKNISVVIIVILFSVSILGCPTAVLAQSSWSFGFEAGFEQTSGEAYNYYVGTESDDYTGFYLSPFADYGITDIFMITTHFDIHSGSGDDSDFFSIGLLAGPKVEYGINTNTTLFGDLIIGIYSTTIDIDELDDSVSGTSFGYRIGVGLLFGKMGFIFRYGNIGDFDDEVDFAGYSRDVEISDITQTSIAFVMKF